jgi:hypothetical protein
MLNPNLLHHVLSGTCTLVMRQYTSCDWRHHKRSPARLMGARSEPQCSYKLVRAKPSPTKSTKYPPTFITSQRGFLFFWRKHGSIKRMDTYTKKGGIIRASAIQ